MHWSATDQFGNLYLGVSSSRSIPELITEVDSLIDELTARSGDAFCLTLDQSFAEISGPDPDRVSHALREVDFDACPADLAVQAIRDRLSERGLTQARIEIA